MSSHHLHVINSNHAQFPDTHIIQMGVHTIILDPALNQEAIMDYLNTNQISHNACELWLSSYQMQSGPYANELAQKLNIPLYAPYTFLSQYRNYPYTAKQFNLCGVYQPKIKADLLKRVETVFMQQIKAFVLSSSIAIYFKTLNHLYYQTVFLSEEDKEKIDHIKHEISRLSF